MEYLSEDELICIIDNVESDGHQYLNDNNLHGGINTKRHKKRKTRKSIKKRKTRKSSKKSKTRKSIKKSKTRKNYAL